MAIKTTKGYRVLSRIPRESLDLYIESFTFGSSETIIVGKSDTLDTTITRGFKKTDGAGNALQIQGGQALGTNQVGGDVRIFAGYPTGNAASGDFQVFGAASKAASGSSVNAANATMLSISGDTGDATFASDIIVGGDKFSNEGSNRALNIVADDNMIFSIDRDASESGNYFSFTKDATGGGAPYGTEIARLDESGNLQIDGSLTIGSTEVINSSAQVSASTIPTSSLYSYQYLNWEVNTNSFTGTNYELPAANGGFGSDSFTINSGVARDTAIDGSVTMSLASNSQQQGWFVPHACKLIAVSGAFRNNGSESNPRDVAIFVGTPDIGTSNASTYTQRLFAAGDDNGGTSNSKIYKVNTVLGTPFSLSAGDIIMPAVCNSTGSSTVSMQGNFNIIIATPIFTI